MKIEVWSDYVCPFCYIGKRKLENALEETGLADHVEVIYKAYQLDPNTPTDATASMHEGLAKKYNMSVDEAKNMTNSIAIQAKEVELDYDFENMKVVNTLNAHRLAKLADQEDVGGEVSEHLMRAHFIDAESIGSDEVLIRIAEEAGIDEARTKAMLASDEFTADVKADIAEAAQLGVQGVPFFVINRKYAISGAQPTETFVEALQKVAEEDGIQPGFKMLNKNDGGVCKDDNCEI